MSSVIFKNDGQSAFVATDTLACDHDGSPGLFTSKALYMPHLKTVFFGTGICGFLNEWFIQTNCHMAVDGIDHLNDFTPERLVRLWASFHERGMVDQKALCNTTTIYHMGVSEKIGEIVGYAYRSADDFKSETIPHGVAVKPDCDVPQGAMDLMAMMEEQRRNQAHKPLKEQIHIGGEIQLIQLTPETCQISTYGRFDDYELARERIYSAIAAHNIQSLA